MPAEKGLLPGKYLVAIDSADPHGPTAHPDQYTMEIPMSKIPAKYNLETTLRPKSIHPRTMNSHFDLQAGNEHGRSVL